MKKVSVVIPFYSNVGWLCEAVDSVLAQTYGNFEIILVNDGSKEDMTGFLAKYGDRLTYVYQENAGAAAARNNGIRHATGDYIAFEDSDDVWLPTLLEKQVAFMESTGARWLHTGFYFWWPESGRLRTVNVSRDYGDDYLQILVSSKVATPSVMIDRGVYAEGDFFFPAGVRNGEDTLLYAKLAKRFPLGLVEEPLVKVRMRGTNSNTHAVERFNLRADIYRDLAADGERLPMMVRLIYGFYRAYAAMFGRRSGPAREFLAKCCWTVPFALERIYVRYLYGHTAKDGRYIQREKHTE